MYNTKYAFLYHSRTDINECIGIGSTHIFKSNLNETAIIKSRLAQWVEHRTTNLKVVSSSPTIGKKFFLFFSLAPYK